jgi:hypothetical protein
MLRCAVIASRFLNARSSTSAPVGATSGETALGNAAGRRRIPSFLRR